MRAWFCWGATMTQAPMEWGTYLVEQPSDVTYHGYHRLGIDTYGSSGSCQWQLFEVNQYPDHLVGSNVMIPQGADATYTGWAGYVPWTGEHNHYFDIMWNFYWDLSSIFSAPGAQTSYQGPL